MISSLAASKRAFLNLKMNQFSIINIQYRCFGPKAKAGAGAGGPVVEYKEPARQKTGLEVFVEKHGEENFLFGKPKGTEKMHNSHRDYIQPKLAATT
jgi:hypothetical protein